MIVGYQRGTGDDHLDAEQEHMLAQVGADRLYMDTARQHAQPGLRACIKSLGVGEVLTIWRLDRLGIGVSGLVRFIERMRQSGWHLHVLTGDLDTRSVVRGWDVFGFMSALAQCERELADEQFNVELAPIPRGRKGGRKPKLPETQVNEIRHVLILRNNALKVRHIAEYYNINTSTLYRSLERTPWPEHPVWEL